MLLALINNAIARKVLLFALVLTGAFFMVSRYQGKLILRGEKTCEDRHALSTAKAAQERTKIEADAYRFSRSASPVALGDYIDKLYDTPNDPETDYRAEACRQLCANYGHEGTEHLKPSVETDDSGRPDGEGGYVPQSPEEFDALQELDVLP